MFRGWLSLDFVSRNPLLPEPKFLKTLLHIKYEHYVFFNCDTFNAQNNLSKSPTSSREPDLTAGCFYVPPKRKKNKGLRADATWLQVKMTV